jgi:hypothetical protein
MIGEYVMTEHDCRRTRLAAIRWDWDHTRWIPTMCSAMSPNGGCVQNEGQYRSQSRRALHDLLPLPASPKAGMRESACLLRHFIISYLIRIHQDGTRFHDPGPVRRHCGRPFTQVRQPDFMIWIIIHCAGSLSAMASGWMSAPLSIRHYHRTVNPCCSVTSIRPNLLRKIPAS